MSSRIPIIDVVRGVAVMGIVLMNIIGFALPERAALTPQNWMPDSWGNTGIWVANFILIDNKMRGLFSLLFGASMLLLIERTDAAGKQGVALHFRRMAWLLLFGLTHYYFIWNGDVLSLYALTGCIAVAFHQLDARRLVALSLLAFVAHFALWATVFAQDIEVDRRSQSGAASAAVLEKAEANRSLWGGPNDPQTTKDIALHQSGYAVIVRERTVEKGDQPITLFIIYGLETFGLMLLGMAALKSGFITGGWPIARYRVWACVCYAFSVPGMLLLTWWCALRGYDPVVTASASVLWSMLFREPMIIAHAALILYLAKQCANAPLTRRISAVGQTAFTNYLGTSVVMTFIFYGYGFGLFGTVTRAQAYLFCFAAWGVMLAWSLPWLRHYRQGPLEWVWRSLARWEVQPLRR